MDLLHAFPLIVIRKATRVGLMGMTCTSCYRPVGNELHKEYIVKKKKRSIIGGRRRCKVMEEEI